MKLSTQLFTTLFFFVVSFSAWSITEHVEILPRAEWPQYENGKNLLSLNQISTVVKSFEEHDKVTVEIRYPGGDYGRKWAESLSAWLVAFGIPLKHQELLPGSGTSDRLVIALIDRR